MGCDTSKNKKLGEDWVFFFKLKETDGSFADLDGYGYSYKIQDSTDTLIKDVSGTISWVGQELAITVPAADTSGYTEGEMKIEFKITDTSGAVFISDVASFYAVSTLHSSS